MVTCSLSLYPRIRHAIRERERERLVGMQLRMSCSVDYGSLSLGYHFSFSMLFIFICFPFSSIFQSFFSFLLGSHSLSVLLINLSPLTLCLYHHCHPFKPLYCYYYSLSRSSPLCCICFRSLLSFTTLLRSFWFSFNSLQI